MRQPGRGESSPGAGAPDWRQHPRAAFCDLRVQCGRQRVCSVAGCPLHPEEPWAHLLRHRGVLPLVFLTPPCCARARLLRLQLRRLRLRGLLLGLRGGPLVRCLLLAQLLQPRRRVWPGRYLSALADLHACGVCLQKLGLRDLGACPRGCERCGARTLTCLLPLPPPSPKPLEHITCKPPGRRALPPTPVRVGMAPGPAARAMLAWAGW